MDALLDDLEQWHRAGEPVVLARLVAVEGSGPRLPGAAMAVSGGGAVAGSVSGGCIEGAVVAEALAMLAAPGDGRRTRLVRFGFSDDDAFAVGLTCGGTVELLLEVLDGGPLDPGGDLFTAFAAARRAGRAVALATVVSGPGPGGSLLVGGPAGTETEPGGERGPVGSLGDPDLDRAVTADAAASLVRGVGGLRRHDLAAGESSVVFIDVFAPPPRLVVFGAADLAAALVRQGRLLGYEVTVCDARPAFATPARFPEADEVIVDWPHRLLERIGPSLGPRDAVCVLTHDAKFDVPAIVAALGTEVGYLGAMGSRRTQTARRARLREAGVDDAALDRLRAPIGLDLGARTPEETAVAICAEIIAVRSGRAGTSLRDGTGPIHTPEGEATPGVG